MANHPGRAPRAPMVGAKADLKPLGRVIRMLFQDYPAMLIAVIEKRCRVKLSDKDVYVSTVGGIRVTEPGADLAIALAIASAYRDKVFPVTLAAVGEISLAGEIRPAPRGQERLKEAAKLGFDTAIIPKANAPKHPIDGLNVIAVDRVEEALEKMRELE